MLYNILPPLIFFSSSGGFIALLARIMNRIRKEKITKEMTQTALQEKPDSSVSVLAPAQEQFELTGSRFAIWRKEFIAFLSASLTWVKRKNVSTDTVEQPVSSRRFGPAIVAAGKSVGLGIYSLFGTIGNSVKKLRSRMPAGRMKVTSAVPEWKSAKASVSEAIHHAQVSRAPRSTRVVEKKPLSTKPVITSRTFKEKMSVVPALIFQKHGSVVVAELKKAYEALEEAHYNQAENILVPYIVKHSRDTAAYVLLGRVAIAKQNWEEAIEIFEQVLTLNPKEAGVYASLGFAAYRAGKFSKALRALQRACEEDPSNKEVLHHLLVLARRMDNRGLQHSIEEKLELLTENAVGA